MRGIIEAGGTSPGSFLSKLHENLDNPAALGSFRIVEEEERSRRGREAQERPREELWIRFLKQVNAYIFTTMTEKFLL